jgi:hypothetical protein
MIGMLFQCEDALVKRVLKAFWFTLKVSISGLIYGTDGFIGIINIIWCHQGIVMSCIIQY